MLFKKQNNLIIKKKEIDNVKFYTIAKISSFITKKKL